MARVFSTWSITIARVKENGVTGKPVYGELLNNARNRQLA